MCVESTLNSYSLRKFHAYNMALAPAVATLYMRPHGLFIIHISSVLAERQRPGSGGGVCAGGKQEMHKISLGLRTPMQEPGHAYSVLKPTESVFCG